MWDGLTGFKDSEKSMFAGLIHDCFYNLIAKEDSSLPSQVYKSKADQYFIELLKENEVPRWKVFLFQFALKFNKPSTKYHKTFHTFIVNEDKLSLN